MAAHPELRLISKIIETSDFRSIVKLRIDQRMFSNPEAKTMFNAIWKYYSNKKHAGKVPRQAWMKKRFKTFRHYNVKETLPELCEEVREAALGRILVDLTDGIENRVKADPYKALEHLRTGVMRTQGMTASSRDVILAEVSDDLIMEYDLIRKAEGITGIPFPWDELNHATMGMHPEDFILLYGRMKSMKSFLGVKMAVHAYIEANRRVLFYSAEMSPKMVMRRMASCLTEVDYGLVKKGRLDREDEIWYKDALASISDDEEKAAKLTGYRRSLLVTSDKDDIRGTGSVSHVQVKAEEFEPDLIIVDSYYRLASRDGKRDYDWKAQAGIAQDLKHLAQTLKIPVIGITQANRKSDKMDSDEGMEDVAYADASGQEADLGLRIVKEGKDNFGTLLKLVVAGAREIEADGFYLRAIPFTRFDFDRWFTHEERNEPPPEPKRRKIKKGAPEPDRGMTKREASGTDSFLSKKRSE